MSTTETPDPIAHLRVSTKPVLMRDMVAICSALTAGHAQALRPLVQRVKALESELAELKAMPFEYAGTHEAGRQYEPRTFVTADGSVWYCRETTTSRPGAGERAWVLACKHGRDAPRT